MTDIHDERALRIITAVWLCHWHDYDTVRAEAGADPEALARLLDAVLEITAGCLERLECHIDDIVPWLWETFPDLTLRAPS